VALVGGFSREGAAGFGGGVVNKHGRILSRPPSVEAAMNRMPAGPTIKGDADDADLFTHVVKRFAPECVFDVLETGSLVS
jgi:hypothetical protein